MRPASAITILVVDDNEGGRYAMSRILRAAGFTVLEAGNGEDALRLAEGRPDLVLLDVKLPGIDGIEVCRRLKSDPRTADIMVLHLSATYVGSEHRTYGLREGADGYLTGPVEPSELLAAVTALLRLREAQRDLQALVRQWQITFDAISDGVVLLDPDGRVLRTNRALGRVVGREVGDVAGRWWREVLPDGAASPTEWPWQRVKTSLRRESGELVVDGRWLQVTADPVLDDEGRLVSIVCIVSDVTARKQMEAALVERARTEALQAEIRGVLAEPAPVDAILQRCAEALVRHLEAAFARIWLIGPAEPILELRASAGLYTHLDGAHSRIRVGDFKIGQIARTRQPVLTNSVPDDPQIHDREWVRREGMVAFAGYPLVIGDGVAGVMALFARHQLPATTLATLGSVADAIGLMLQRREAEAERDELLRREKVARAEAEAAVGLRDEFLARASHELRTPLTVVKGHLALLMKQIDGRKPGTAALMRTAGRHIDRMTRLIAELLDASRLEAGRLQLVREPIELDAIVDEAITEAQPLAVEKEVTLASRVPTGLRLAGDRFRLEQVVLNLLTNAIKFTPQGGRVRVEAGARAGGVELRIADTGIGIAPEHLERIFEPFFQVGSATGRRKAAGQGAGLGLAIARRLVELHGGRIWAESRGIGRGTTFVVTLPGTPA